MGDVTFVPPSTNQTQLSNITNSPPEYNDVELVLLGVAMAVLVLAIVFGKYKKCRSQCLANIFTHVKLCYIVHYKHKSPCVHLDFM